MDPIQGGQSGTAPTCSTTSAGSRGAESSATITESVVGSSGLFVEVSDIGTLGKLQ
jgi:hypothetical protein